MKNKRIKNLVVRFSWPELLHYIETHENVKIPNANEAQEFDYDECEHKEFWVDEQLGDRNVLYDKKKQCFKVTHSMFKHHAVLKRV